ncbi:homoserine kinase [Brevibacterium sanguinis]|uniref:Homoserine kinase n=2 Tax=Brevibacterium TaxID=1696 RepID=A0A366IMS8_9MICO|nr:MULTISPECIES: homoserine kinase [Brevibacterium]RBP66339.1 homoserine kinase [Brevibacterium sanguinis]RBP72990.1 homoserine kinase [Brevibacterium celere]
MSLTIEVPATSANLGPGYDSFGIALGLCDTLTVTIHDDEVDPADCVSVTGESAESLPRDRSHLVMRVLCDVLAAEYGAAVTGLAERLRLECVNRIPHSRGLGSSAAAVVAGVALAGAVAEHCGAAGLPRERVLELATDLEGHPDNAAPAIFGGLTIALSAPARAWRIPVHTVTDVTVIVPESRLDTAIARSLMPASVEHEIAAENSARTGLLVHGFTSDAAVLMDATADLLHQEFRREAYPESMDLVDRLRAAGHPAVISGAGPTVLVLSDSVDPSFAPASTSLIRTSVDLAGYRIARSR